MPTLLKRLGISSQQEAAELEQDLGIRFNDLTPQQCETWRQQSIYLYQYARTRTFTHAVKAAGVSLRTARTWQTENTLGFNQRLELAVLEYTEEIEVLLLERARQPDSPPTFLTMLLRAQMPEKYGPARRYSAPARDNHSDHDDDPKPEPSHTPNDGLPPVGADPIPTNDLPQTPVGAGFKPAHIPSHTPNDDLPPVGADPIPTNDLSQTPVGVVGFKPAHIPSHTLNDDLPPVGADPIPTNDLPQTPVVGAGFKPAPTLSRQQRRQLQRQSKRKQQKTKQPASHLPRAPN